MLTQSAGMGESVSGVFVNKIGDYVRSLTVLLTTVDVPESHRDSREHARVVLAETFQSAVRDVHV